MPSILRRYTKALLELRFNNEIITTADKGGEGESWTLMTTMENCEEMLGENNTYIKQSRGQSESEAEKSNKVRSILRKTEEEKLLHLLRGSKNAHYARLAQSPQAKCSSQTHQYRGRHCQVLQIGKGSVHSSLRCAGENKQLTPQKHITPKKNEIK